MDGSSTEASVLSFVGMCQIVADHMHCDRESKADVSANLAVATSI